MKINRTGAANPLLSADFAPRVIAQVSRIRRRRRLVRRALTVTAVLALGAGSFFAERHQSISPLQPAVVLLPPGGGGNWTQPVSYQEQPQPPVNLFLPDTYLMTNFEDSTGESSWHSYDSWWSSNS
jgi:hypothetical protein